MIRCVNCGSSRLDSKGIRCARCGGASAVRWECCHITEETTAKLLVHADELKSFGVTLEEYRSVGKNFGDVVSVIGLALQIAESLSPGVLRKIVLYLREIAIPEEEILRLRLDEPEYVLDVLGTQERKNQS